MSTRKVNLAIDNIEDSISGDGEFQDHSTLAEKFDRLGQEIISDGYDILMRLKTKGQRLDEDTEYLQSMKIRQFNVIASVFMRLKKQGRISDDKPNEKFDQELIEMIKKKRSSVGEIVRDTTK